MDSLKQTYAKVLDALGGADTKLCKYLRDPDNSDFDPSFESLSTIRQKNETDTDLEVLICNPLNDRFLSYVQLRIENEVSFLKIDQDKTILDAMWNDVNLLHVEFSVISTVDTFMENVYPSIRDGHRDVKMFTMTDNNVTTIYNLKRPRNLMKPWNVSSKRFKSTLDKCILVIRIGEEKYVCFSDFMKKYHKKMRQKYSESFPFLWFKALDAFVSSVAKNSNRVPGNFIDQSGQVVNIFEKNKDRFTDSFKRLFKESYELNLNFAQQNAMTLVSLAVQGTYDDESTFSIENPFFRDSTVISSQGAPSTRPAAQSIQAAAPSTRPSAQSIRTVSPDTQPLTVPQVTPVEVDIDKLNDDVLMNPHTYINDDKGVKSIKRPTSTDTSKNSFADNFSEYINTNKNNGEKEYVKVLHALIHSYFMRDKKVADAANPYIDASNKYFKHILFKYGIDYKLKDVIEAVKDNKNNLFDVLNKYDENAKELDLSGLFRGSKSSGKTINIDTSEKKLPVKDLQDCTMFPKIYGDMILALAWKITNKDDLKKTAYVFAWTFEYFRETLGDNNSASPKLFKKINQKLIDQINKSGNDDVGQMLGDLLKNMDSKDPNYTSASTVLNKLRPGTSSKNTNNKQQTTKQQNPSGTKPKQPTKGQAGGAEGDEDVDLSQATFSGQSPSVLQSTQRPVMSSRPTGVPPAVIDLRYAEYSEVLEFMMSISFDIDENDRLDLSSTDPVKKVCLRPLQKDIFAIHSDAYITKEDLAKYQVLTLTFDLCGDVGNESSRDVGTHLDPMKCKYIDAPVCTEGIAIQGLWLRLLRTNVDFNDYNRWRLYSTFENKSGVFKSNYHEKQVLSYYDRPFRITSDNAYVTIVDESAVRSNSGSIENVVNVFGDPLIQLGIDALNSKYEPNSWVKCSGLSEIIDLFERVIIFEIVEVTHPKDHVFLRPELSFDSSVFPFFTLFPRYHNDFIGFDVVPLKNVVIVYRAAPTSSNLPKANQSINSPTSPKANPPSRSINSLDPTSYANSIEGGSASEWYAYCIDRKVWGDKKDKGTSITLKTEEVVKLRHRNNKNALRDSSFKQLSIPELLASDNIWSKYLYKISVIGRGLNVTLQEGIESVESNSPNEEDIKSLIRVWTSSVASYIRDHETYLRSHRRRLRLLNENKPEDFEKLKQFSVEQAKQLSMKIQGAFDAITKHIDIRDPFQNNVTTALKLLKLSADLPVFVDQKFEEIKSNSLLPVIRDVFVEPSAIVINCMKFIRVTSLWYTIELFKDTTEHGADLLTWLVAYLFTSCVIYESVCFAIVSIIKITLDIDDLFYKYAFDAVVGNMCAFSIMYVIAIVYGRRYGVSDMDDQDSLRELIAAFRLTAWRVGATLIAIPYFRMV